MIRDILEDDKKEFIKNYLNGIKKEDLINHSSSSNYSRADN